MPVVNRREHPSGLSVKAQACVEHYLVHGDKRAAYLHGFGRGRANERVFTNLVHKFFERPAVLAEIQRRRAAISEATDITVERIVQRLAQFAFTDLPGIAQFDGTTMTVEDFAKLTPQQRAAIKKFEFVRDPPTETTDADGNVRQVEGQTKVKLELEDRVACIVKLGQHIGMWEKKPRQAIVDAPLFNIVMPALEPVPK